MKFKKEFPEERRIQESNKILSKYPTRIPIIVEKSDNCELSDISKKKYLVPKDLNLQQFVYIIRKRINIDSSKALFVTIDNSLSPASLTLGEIYDTKKDNDGFLYVIYSSENTFG
jgi:GABA(A) receptor-associated protein